ncbi:S9 family peptidase [Longimicrobium sp.]|uniref:S9 family peptidase n=1 Tax=Longimicrobium sp. TaxID=2029185 RepID=UPI002BC6BDCC|nr:S9 family peptidase [Longimicrobium sp.]HSU15348.1 S9 family peptidase [Longimicrobium sp.]
MHSIPIARTAVLLASALALAAVPVRAQERRPLTPLDLYHLRTASQTALSPDGRSVAYVVLQADSATKKYRRELWLARTDGSGARRLTWLNVSASAPAFSPDGRQLAFVSARESNPPQIWVLPLAEGGEAWPLTSLEHGAGSPAWSPRGDRIAFISSLKPLELDSAAAKADTAKGDAATIQHIDRDRAAALRAIRARLRDDAKDDDPQVVSRLGYLTETSIQSGDEWGQLYVVDARSGATPKRLTSNPWNTGEAQWSPDGRWIVATSTQPRGDYHPDYELEGQVILVPADGGAATRLHETGYQEGAPRFSPDGRWIAYQRQSTARPYYTAVNTELVVMHPDGTGRTSISAPMDRSVAAHRWAAGGWLYFTVPSDGAISLYRVRPGQGAPQRIVSGPRGVLSFDVAGPTIAWTQMSPARPSDVYAAALDGGGERRLTTLNDSLLSRVYVADYEEIRYPSFDGKPVQGWFLRPIGWRAGMRPPLAVEMHGGPHVMWGPGEASMWLEYQSLAGAGYTVFFSNPRGSEGYGQAWLQAIHENWGTPPARDILTGADSVLARGLADPAKQVVTGGSYAGYMTAWLIAKEVPERFRAAVAQRGVYDLTIWWGSANTWQLFEGEFGGRPWEQPELARAQSPLTYVANVRTPLLMLHGAQDNRVGVASAEAFYRGLKEENREVEMVLYPREGHEVTRSGEPEHRIDHMLRIIDWFERHVTH